MNKLSYDKIYSTLQGNAIGLNIVDGYEFVNLQNEDGLISNIYDGTGLKCVVQYTYVHDRMDYNVLYTNETLTETEIENLLEQFTEQWNAEVQ